MPKPKPSRKPAKRHPPKTRPVPQTPIALTYAILDGFMERYGAYAFGTLVLIIVMGFGAFFASFILREIRSSFMPVLDAWNQNTAGQQQVAAAQEVNLRAMETNLRLAKETLNLADRTLTRIDRIDDRLHTVAPQ